MELFRPSTEFGFSKRTDAFVECLKTRSESASVASLGFLPMVLNGGAVKTLNAVNQKLAQELANPDSPPYLYGGLKREQLVRTGSVILHELYFENLGGKDETSAGLRSDLAAEFGDFTTWQLEFKRIAQSFSGGSGWAILGYNTHFRRLQIYALADHTQNAPSSVPLLVPDMYEHSYQMDYGAAAAKEKADDIPYPQALQNLFMVSGIGA